MIQEILRWAAGSFHIIEARAVVLSMGRPGGPVAVLDLDSRVFLAFVEGVLREAPHHAQQLDELYAASIPTPPQSATEKRAERRAEIDRLARLFGS